jgi:two-component system chemotaxis sensor kinase CheA
MDSDETLIALFHSEATELLEALDACLLDLSAAPDDPELIDRAFRLLHTLKGVSAMYGYDALSAAAHSLESAFDEARQTHTPVSREQTESALREADWMRNALGEPQGQPSRIATSSAELPAARTLRIALHPSPNASSRGLRLDAVVAELESLGQCTLVDAEEGFASENLAGHPVEWCADLVTAEDRERVLEALMFLGPEEYSVEERSATAERRAGEDRRQTKRRTTDARDADTIRVASHRLDELVDLVGELVTAHGTMSSLASQTNDPRLTAVAEEIGRLAGALRGNALSIRMVPIGSVFGRFRRHVHDLANDLGKQVEISMHGGETELDKGVLDHLFDPILHILRNSLDHGIEAPSKRVAAGKDPVGRIDLRASQSGGRVHLFVADDGAGIDFARVREKAIERGLVNEHAQPDEETLGRLLFDAGFSTAADITSVSGRGVGMDVVKRALDGLHGTVSLSSPEGRGTEIKLSLPLTLAIIDGLISAVGTERYAIPLSAVEECAEVNRPRAWKEHGRELLDVHGTFVPLVDLRSVFGVAGDAPEYQIAVIVRTDEHRYGIVVDALVDSVQTVIKPLGSFLRDAGGVSGTTVLGDGGVVPIIDPAELIRVAKVELSAS